MLSGWKLILSYRFSKFSVTILIDIKYGAVLIDSLTLQYNLGLLFGLLMYSSNILCKEFGSFFEQSGIMQCMYVYTHVRVYLCMYVWKCVLVCMCVHVYGMCVHVYRPFVRPSSGHISKTRYIEVVNLA
jgi:hypothetical protein